MFYFQQKMNLSHSIMILALMALVLHCESQDSATATINNLEPFVGDTIIMSCTLVRQEQFRRESVSYIVNDEFNVDSSLINANSGTVGGIEVSRMQASTAASDDNRVTLSGQIILNNVQISDAVGGNIKLGCVGMFGSNQEDNINATALADVTEVIPDNADATLNNDKPVVGETLEVNCVLFTQRGFTEDTVRYIVNDAYGILASMINQNSGLVGGIEAARLQASADSSEDGVTLSGRIILSNVQISDAVNGSIELGCVGVVGNNPMDYLNVSRIAAVPSGASQTSITFYVVISSFFFSLIFF